MRHRNLRSDSVLVHSGYIGTGAILVPGFGTQPYSYHIKPCKLLLLLHFILKLLMLTTSGLPII